MNIKTEWKKLAWMVGLFLLFFWLPVNRERFINGIIESFQLSRWYAREHVLLCLVPACAFLYSGLAINTLAIILTARILGVELGIALAVGAISFSVITGAWTTLWGNKWLVISVSGVLLGIILIIWFNIAWGKVVLAAIAPVVLAFALPTEGMWVMIPFSAAVVGLSIISASQEGEPADWFGATFAYRTAEIRSRQGRDCGRARGPDQLLPRAGRCQCRPCADRSGNRD